LWGGGVGLSNQPPSTLLASNSSQAKGRGAEDGRAAERGKRKHSRWTTRWRRRTSGRRGMTGGICGPGGREMKRTSGRRGKRRGGGGVPGVPLTAVWPVAVSWELDVWPPCHAACSFREAQSECTVSLLDTTQGTHTTPTTNTHHNKRERDVRSNTFSMIS